MVIPDAPTFRSAPAEVPVALIRTPLLFFIWIPPTPPPTVTPAPTEANVPSMSDLAEAIDVAASVELLDADRTDRETAHLERDVFAPVVQGSTAPVVAAKA